MRKIVLSVFTMLIMCFQLAAQNQRVTGTVTDAASGEPVMGATVVVKGTQNAAVTGMEGEYTLNNVPANSVLVFEYLGYAKQEVTITAGMTVANVKLSEDNEQIEQVVVIGYGSARSVGSVTGSVSVVDANILNDKPVMNVADALSGQVSGMSVMTSSGEPSQSSSIRIHGAGSISAGTEPLYVIDGMPSSANQFLAINSNDIENMVTLKDASATSIYGSRAANGVIYVTTKKGSRRAQRAQFRFSGNYGVSTPVNNKFRQMNGYDLLDWQLYFGEISQTDYATYKDRLDTFGAVDWFRYIYQTAPTYTGEFSVNGGSENIGYYVSGSYMNQDGMAPQSSMERYTMRTNLSAQANSWLRINLNLAAAVDKRESTQGALTSQGLNPTSVTNFPIYMATYMTRQYFDEETGRIEDYLLFPNNMIDPYYVMEKAPQWSNNHLLNGNFSVVLTPVKGLTITSLNGIDGAYSTYTFTALPSHFASGGTGSRTRQFSQYYTLSTSNTIEYKFEPIKDMHNITLLVGQEGIDYYSQGFMAGSSGQIDDALYLIGKGTQVKMSDVSESYSSYNMLSFFGRVNYEYGRKYAFDLTLRNDASSRFGKDNRNALFYAIGGMWNIKEENFLKDNRVLTDLKLRVTYGTQGNSSISNYASLRLVSTGANYGDVSGKYFASTGNNYLGWEKQGLFNVSLEFGLFNWLSVSATYYDRRSSDMLYDVPYPPSSGITSRGENALKMKNQGVDLDINATLFHNDDWNITIGAVFGYNNNKITQLYGTTTSIPQPDSFRTYEVGKSAWSFYMPVFMGVDPRDGKAMYDDGNGNPVKDTNLAAYITLDKQYIAPYNGGFDLSASWKGLSLQVNFAYQLDKWLTNGDRFFNESSNIVPRTARPEYMKNIWREPGQVTNIPKYGETSLYSTAYLENASYLRLKNLSLSYQLPQSLLKKTGFIQGVKFSVVMRNLWTLTNYTGYDPEYDSSIIYGMYPNTRQYSFGLELVF